MNESDPPAPSILVIDDNPNNLAVICRYLEENRFDVMIARDGEDGIVKARKGTPDLILLDVMMPGPDGFETCLRLKEDDRTRQIPVLFMTALDGLRDKLQGFQAGGVDYITKPFDEQEALARIRTHLMIRNLQKRLEARNRSLEETNRRLSKAMAEIKTLRGIIPICAACKKIRDDNGYWSQIESYIRDHSEADFSHGICPACAEKMYPELFHEVVEGAGTAPGEGD